MTKEITESQIIFMRMAEIGNKLFNMCKNNQEALNMLIYNNKTTKKILYDMIIYLLCFQEEVIISKEAFIRFDESLSNIYLILADKAEKLYYEYDEENFQNIIVTLIEKIAEINGNSFDENCILFNSIIENILLKAKFLKIN